MRGGALKGVAVAVLVAILATGCAEMQANPKMIVGTPGECSAR
ncbi:MAG: hypothetical protein H6Q86_4197 [candidate division NC10 bacterium]|nr:hypothetical protein [candidate division NC10 bacterium]